MDVSQKDKEILQELGTEAAKIAELSVHQEKVEMWKKLNSLNQVKPMVWINEIPWNEMNVDDELTLETENEFCQQLETRLRRKIYKWNHMRGDMVVEPKIDCSLVIHDTGFGIGEDVKIARTDETNSVVSRDFNPQIEDESDLEKIKMPEVTYNEAATEARYQLMQDIFDGILQVEKKGVAGFWFALQYEIRWMKRFGLNYYGCCEPLHQKLGILKQVPNLRKISMSPWVDVEEGADSIGDDYVYSMKPSPSVLASDKWNLDIAREELETKLEQTRGCNVEVIMKDISTVRYQPQRLWEWAEMAREVTEKFV